MKNKRGMSLGEAIRFQREGLRLSGSEAARRMGYSQAYLSGVELGTSRPRTHCFLAAVANVLDMEYDWLCYLAGILPQDVVKCQYSEAQWMRTMKQLRGARV